MSIYKHTKIITALLIATMTSLLLVACGDQQKKSPAIKIPVKKYAQLKILKGAVREGDIKVTDSKGRLIASTSLDGSKNYSVEIPAGTTLPIVITVKPEGSAEKLKAVVISTTVSRYDISPLTTKIANRAKELGGTLALIW